MSRISRVSASANGSSNLEITSAQLRSLAPIVKISGLAREAGIPYSTLAMNLRRGLELSVEEAQRITAVLRRYGFGRVTPVPVPKRIETSRG
jgi:hypothetical protein